MWVRPKKISPKRFKRSDGSVSIGLERLTCCPIGWGPVAHRQVIIGEQASQAHTWRLNCSLTTSKVMKFPGTVCKNQKCEERTKRQLPIPFVDPRHWMFKKKVSDPETFWHWFSLMRLQVARNMPMEKLWHLLVHTICGGPYGVTKDREIVCAERQEPKKSCFPIKRILLIFYKAWSCKLENTRKVNILAILCDLFGVVKWPFKWLSDLQLGDKNVTLNHLGGGFKLNLYFQHSGLSPQQTNVSEMMSCMRSYLFQIILGGLFQFKAVTISFDKTWVHPPPCNSG